MGNYGIKISLPGKDVSSSTNGDFVLWSKFPYMKTFLVGTYDYTFPSDVSSVEITITHNKASRAVAWLSLTSTANSTWKSYDRWLTYYNSGGNKALRIWRAKSQTNTYLINYSESNVEGSGVDPTGEAWTFKYYIFSDVLV